MTEQQLFELLNTITPADAAAMCAAEARQAQLAKPPHSLGRLEDISVRLAGIFGTERPTLGRTGVLVFAADNGVCAEGVSCTPQSVTREQAVNMTRGLTGMSTLARFFGDEVIVTDVGILTDTHCPAVRDRKIRHGTENFAQKPAMLRSEAVQAISVGIETVREAKAAGLTAVGIGEMGIGNTTTSSAVLCALTGASVADVTGRGGGLTDEGYQKKLAVIEAALALHRPDANDPIDVLTKVGGLDLAAMTGAYLGCAAEHIPAVVDGFISIVAALCAVRLCPAARDYLILSHASYEIGYRIAAEELRQEPCLLLEMRLGEGSGCPLMFQIMRAACAVLCEMATFEEASIHDGYLDEIRKTDAFTVARPLRIYSSAAARAARAIWRSSSAAVWAGRWSTGRRWSRWTARIVPALKTICATARDGDLKRSRPRAICPPRLTVSRRMQLCSLTARRPCLPTRCSARTERWTKMRARGARRSCSRWRGAAAIWSASATISGGMGRTMTRGQRNTGGSSPGSAGN